MAAPGLPCGQHLLGLVQIFRHATNLGQNLCSFTLPAISDDHSDLVF
jgi:hypothetical protein